MTLHRPHYNADNASTVCKTCAAPWPCSVARAGQEDPILMTGGIRLDVIDRDDGVRLEQRDTMGGNLLWAGEIDTANTAKLWRRLGMYLDAPEEIS